MSKNAIIGVLSGVVLVGGVAYLVSTAPKSSSVSPVNTGTNTMQTSSGGTNSGATPRSNSPATTPLVLGLPIVETNSSVNSSSSTALVTGQVNPNGVPTTYWFEYGTTSGSLLSRTEAQQIGSGHVAIYSPAYITGLRSNTSYYFRLMANNSFGTVYGAEYGFSTNASPAPRVAAPTARTNNATSVSRTSATMNGQVNPNGWQTNYWFEYGTDSNLGNITSVTSVDSNSSTSSVAETLSGLEPLTKYYFRLNAQNQYGTVNGAILSFTTSGPTNPAAPTVNTTSASAVSSSSARFNGRINPNGADTDYWFEYSTDSLLGSVLGTKTNTATLNAGNSTVSVNQTVSGLDKSTKYYYRLIASNQYGTVQGDVVTFQTQN